MATYGLVNANGKVQTQSDNLLLNRGLCKVIDVSRLFYYQSDGNLQASIAKIFDDILVKGDKDVVDEVPKSIDVKLKFEKIVHGPGKLQYCGSSITQHED